MATVRILEQYSKYVGILSSKIIPYGHSELVLFSLNF